ncbi:UNKNOWN [Stylonychia lemnae]|uniref:Endonuclease/exonuclease/phosphatase domain-containing protein n=1 Tax=Stylonychia lemnae TaxID=5949 RepID=A0A077ZQN3_STYLE|nr:UNKNOWN [Stylonychia lemnae]|eukprot:CDW71759.1 UNKNOWN [Stylonychia lemnae]
MTTPELGRGGVAVLSKYDSVNAKMLKIFGNTGGIIQISYKSRDESDDENHYFSNKMILFPAYINPNPTKEEQQWIKEYMDRLEETLHSTRHPIIAIGDFNTKGHKLMRQIAMKDIMKRIQFTFQCINSQGNQVQSKPDGIYVSKLKNKKADVTTMMIQERENDHRAVIALLDSLIIERPYKQHKRSDIEMACQITDLLNEIVHSSIPYNSAEQIISKYSIKSDINTMKIQKIIEDAYLINREEKV